MYTVIREFHNKENLKKVYRVGDEFSSNEPKRVKDLLDRGLIEGEATPSYESLTKNKIIGLLEEKGIEYDSKLRKEELIELLKIGG